MLTSLFRPSKNRSKESFLEKAILRLGLAGLLLFAGVSTTAAQDPIRIGGTLSLEGKYKATSFMMQKGYELWAEETNKKGGILGRRVELLFYDDKSREDLVKAHYTKLITVDGVDLVLSPYGTPLTLAASEITEAHNYVMLACTASGETIWERGHNYIFGVYAPANRYFIGFLDLMARNGLTSLGIIHENSSFNIAVVRGVGKWAKRFGLSLDHVYSFNNPDKELPEILKQSAKDNTDGLIFSAYPPECHQAIRIMKADNYHPRNLAMTIAPVFPDFFEKAGAFAEGIFGASQWEPDERLPFPGTASFIKNFKILAGKAPSYHACSAYSACQILEKAINHDKDIDHDKIKNFVQSLDTVTVMGRFKVDHTGRQIGHNPILIQWQEGKKEVVYPLKMKTALPRIN